jgi:hypothetical protein
MKNLLIPFTLALLLASCAGTRTLTSSHAQETAQLQQTVEKQASTIAALTEEKNASAAHLLELESQARVTELFTREISENLSIIKSRTEYDTQLADSAGKSPVKSETTTTINRTSDDRQSSDRQELTELRLNYSALLEENSRIQSSLFALSHENDSLNYLIDSTSATTVEKKKDSTVPVIFWLIAVLFIAGTVIYMLYRSQQ